MDSVRVTLKAFRWEFILLPVIDEDDTHIIEPDVPLHGNRVEQVCPNEPGFFVVSDNDVEISRINPSLLSFHNGHNTTAVDIKIRYSETARIEG